MEDGSSYGELSSVVCPLVQKSDSLPADQGTFFDKMA